MVLARHVVSIIFINNDGLALFGSSLSRAQNIHNNSLFRSEERIRRALGKQSECFVLSDPKYFVLLCDKCHTVLIDV